MRVQGSSIRASWRIHVGRALFPAPGVRQEGPITLPQFAHYQLTVRGGTLAQDVVRTFDAVPGENVRDDETLAEGLGPGTYHVLVFIHVQYVDPQGKGHILNDNADSVEVEK